MLEYFPNNSLYVNPLYATDILCFQYNMYVQYNLFQLYLYHNLIEFIKKHYFFHSLAIPHNVNVCIIGRKRNFFVSIFPK